jgi:hypothetical protein
MHGHFQDTLLILNRFFFFAQILDIRDHRDPIFEMDFGSGITDVETQVEDILDGLAETPGIDDEFKEVDGGVSTEELTDRSDHLISRIFLLLNIPFFQLHARQLCRNKTLSRG